MKTFLTTEAWEIVYADPIMLKKGDTVLLTQAKTEDNPEWHGWTWCEVPGNAGWIPEQIVQRNPDGSAHITADYSAQELAVSAGETVFSDTLLNGWRWCRNARGDAWGWLPANILAEQAG